MHPRRKTPNSYLVKEMLCAVRRNRDEVNAKITRIRMAHLYLIRPRSYRLSLLLLVIVLWKFAAAGLEVAWALGSDAWNAFGL